MNGDTSTSCNLSNCDCDKPKAPHALTREQVEEYTSRFYACGFLYMKKVFEDHDAAQRDAIEHQIFTINRQQEDIAALRHALTQQAQELESTRELNRISAVALSEKEQEIERLTDERDDRQLWAEALAVEKDSLQQQLAAMTAERDAWKNRCEDKWDANTKLRREIEKLREDFNCEVNASISQGKQLAASQQKVRELEERLIESEKAAYDVAGVIDHLKATLAERERELEQTRVQLAGCLTAAEGHNAEPAQQGDYGWSVAYQATRDLRISYDTARQDAARLREALKAVLPIAVEWCSPEEAKEVAAIKQAQAALKGA